MSAPASRGPAEIAAEIRTVEAHLRAGWSCPDDCRATLDALFAELDQARAAEFRNGITESEAAEAKALARMYEHEHVFADGVCYCGAGAKAEPVVHLAGRDNWACGRWPGPGPIARPSWAPSSRRLGEVTCPACLGLVGVRGELLARFPDATAQWEAQTAECREETAALLVRITRAYLAADPATAEWMRRILGAYL